MQLLVPAARLLPVFMTERLLDHVASVKPHAAFDAPRLEARGILSSERATFVDAARVYDSLGLRYEQARCLLAAGDRSAAAAVIETIGASKGPLGVLLGLAG